MSPFGSAGHHPWYSLPTPPIHSTGPLPHRFSFSNKTFVHNSKRSRGATYAKWCRARSLRQRDTYRWTSVRPPSSSLFPSQLSFPAHYLYPPSQQTAPGARRPRARFSGRLPWAIVTAKPCHRHPLFNMGINQLRRREIVTCSLQPLIINIKHLLVFIEPLTPRSSLI
jgi:hypothetical protein